MRQLSVSEVPADSNMGVDNAYLNQVKQIIESNTIFQPRLQAFLIVERRHFIVQCLIERFILKYINDLKLSQRAIL